MSNEQQNDQTENQGQSRPQNQDQPQPQEQPQQATLDQLLQGRDKSIEVDVIESDPSDYETRTEERN